MLAFFAACTATTASAHVSALGKGGRSPFHIVLYFMCLLPANAFPCSAGACRFGEAQHPGPSFDFWISTSNPSGLRGKELHAAEMGVGVHCFSETQLSAVTLPQVDAQLRALCRRQGRNLRVASGAPAPLRAHSEWAGSWSGVLLTADWPLHPVRIPWPRGMFETARVQIAQVLAQGCPLLFANVYGYSRSHLQAAAATDALLEPVTKEVVLGRAGPRIVCGDLSADESALLQVQIWRQQGWLELQELAWQRWGRVPCATCKDATRRDFLYLSPEAAALCIDSSVTDIFQEHSTISAKLRIASNAGVIRCWPRPAEIPWSCIALDGLNGQPHAPLPPYLDTTHRFHKHAQMFEQSLNGHVDCPGRQLPAGCFGRARFTEPVQKPVAISIPKASRAGDEILKSDLLSLEVRHWHKQLRRLQSLWQALQRPRYDLNALEYRGCLWRSILDAQGFRNGFAAWWPTRPRLTTGQPRCIANECPGPQLCACHLSGFSRQFPSL